MVRESNQAESIERLWEQHPLGNARVHGCQSNRMSAPRIRDVIWASSEVFSVPYNFILAERRSKKIVLARHMAMYVAYQITFSSTTMIGRAFGNRDHTTVLHAIKKVNALVAEGREDVIDNIAAIKERASRIKRDWLNDKVDG